MIARKRGGPRWALSFADLAMLLLGFSILMQARPDPVPLTAGLRRAFGAAAAPTLTQAADRWFEPGEAVLRPQARAAIRRFAGGAHAAIVSSHGTEAAAARFDGWELAAARTAAVARELAAAGIPQARVTVSIAPGTGGGQRLAVSRS